MSGGTLSGGPVSKFLSTTSNHGATQSRMSQFVTAAPAVDAEEGDDAPATPPPSSAEDAADAPASMEVPNTDPWSAKEKRVRKPSAQPMKEQEAWIDDDSDDEDDDFDGHESDSSDSGGDSDSSDSESGDDVPVDFEPVRVSDKKRTPVEDAVQRKRPVVEAVPRKPRKSHKEQLAELQRRYGLQDNDDEDDGESLDSDDEDDDEDDDDGDDALDPNVVRDDAYRLRSALQFKATVLPVRGEESLAALSKAGTPEFNALMAEYSKKRDSAALNKLFTRLGDEGVDVNAEAPDIPEDEFASKKKVESDDDDDDDSDDDLDDAPEDEEDEQESPIHQLVPKIVMVVEKDEPDLSELMSKLSKGIFNAVLMEWRKTQPKPSSLELPKALEAVWGRSSTSAFYHRVRDLAAWLNHRTQLRHCHRVLLAFDEGFRAQALCEFSELRVIVNETHDRHKDPYPCIACGCKLEPVQMESGANLAYMRAIELLHRKQSTNNRPNVGPLQYSSPILTRPQGSLSGAPMWICDTCIKIVPIMNRLLTVGHDLSYLARLWIEERRDHVLKVVASGGDVRALSTAFHQSQERRELCDSIVWAYKMMHAVALN